MRYGDSGAIAGSKAGGMEPTYAMKGPVLTIRTVALPSRKRRYCHLWTGSGSCQQPGQASAVIREVVSNRIILILETTAVTITAAMQRSVSAVLVKSNKGQGETTMSEMESNAMALALIDILYAQGVIDHELYYRIQAKNKAFVKAEKD